MFIMIGSEPKDQKAETLPLRLKNILAAQLRLGVTPSRLSFALALGITLGVIPSVWGASLLCLFFAALFRLNQVAVQLANYLVYPLQFLLFIPYFRLGSFLFSSQLLPEDLTTLITMLQTAPLEVGHRFWQANLQAIAAWMLTAPLLWGGSCLVILLLTNRHNLLKW